MGGGGSGVGSLDSYTLPLFSDVGFFSTDFARGPLLGFLLFSNS